MKKPRVTFSAARRTGSYPIGAAHIKTIKVNGVEIGSVQRTSRDSRDDLWFWYARIGERFQNTASKPTHLEEAKEQVRKWVLAEEVTPCPA